MPKNMSANYLRYNLKLTLSYWFVWKLPRPACPLAVLPIRMLWNNLASAYTTAA